LSTGPAASMSFSAGATPILAPLFRTTLPRRLSCWGRNKARQGRNSLCRHRWLAGGAGYHFRHCCPRQTGIKLPLCSKLALKRRPARQKGAVSPPLASPTVPRSCLRSTAAPLGRA
jgi:hypothetical protein